MAFGTNYAKQARAAQEGDEARADVARSRAEQEEMRPAPSAPVAAPVQRSRVSVAPPTASEAPPPATPAPASRGRFQPLTSAPTAPVSVSAPAPVAAPAPAPAGRFRPLAAPAAASEALPASAASPLNERAPVSAPVRAPVAGAADARPRFQGNGSPPPRDEDEVDLADPMHQVVHLSGQGYAALDRSQESRRPDGLPLQLEALIDKVAERRDLPDEAVENFKRQAVKDVPNQLRRFETLYQNEVKPALDKQVHSLEQALVEHPDQVVFLVLKGNKRSLKVMPVDQAGPSRLLHGAVVEVVRASATPFRRPAEVYGAPASQVTEAAVPVDTAAAAPSRPKL